MIQPNEMIAHLKRKFDCTWPHPNELTRLLSAAVEAKAIGRGGIPIVRCACGPSRSVIAKGIHEIDRQEVFPAEEIRRKGGREGIRRASRSRGLYAASVAAGRGGSGGRGHPRCGNDEYLSAHFQDPFGQVIEQVIALRLIGSAEVDVSGAIVNSALDFPVRLNEQCGNAPVRHGPADQR